MRHSHTTCAVLLAACALLAACLGEDRSDEQPFPPTVQTLSARVSADSCYLHGQVLTSPNSSVTGRGFHYGNDTLRVQLVADGEGALGEFRDTIAALRPGHYYVCAFAANGMGTAYGDTIRFSVE